MSEKTLLLNNFDSMVEVLQKTLCFKSVKDEHATDTPFGKQIDDCLNYVLDTASQMGFETFNCDGFAGHIDFKGKTNEVIGVLGHLDVVPADISDGWKFDPFSATLSDGKLFGRGAMDDKGPMIACLFGLKALKDSGFVPQKTIRLIFGCDEESGMSCLPYYFERVAPPSASFSPDGDFPVINREKGIYQCEFDFGKLPREIVEIVGGDRTNVVVAKCQAKLSKSVDISNVDCTVEDKGEYYLLTTHGQSAHASLPYDGKNASWQMFKQLAKLFPDSTAIQFVANHMCDFWGKHWGINLSDEPSGQLTCNIGVLKTVERNLKVSVDVRFPVTYKICDIENLFDKTTPYPRQIEHAKEPLYVPASSKLVSTLLSVYNDITNSNAEAICIGGGTYSRCLDNCVAFGPLFPKEVQTIHMPNENIVLDNLKQMALIYMEAMKRLSAE